MTNTIVLVIGLVALAAGISLMLAARKGRAAPGAEDPGDGQSANKVRVTVTERDNEVRIDVAPSVARIENRAGAHVDWEFGSPDADRFKFQLRRKPGDTGPWPFVPPFPAGDAPPTVKVDLPAAVGAGAPRLYRYDIIVRRTGPVPLKIRIDPDIFIFD